ncbi:MAG: serine/threonine protein kinase, partial [Planctomycetes bacterium]|nr:serine/threonine protein kinase [Planctomycetota bacterium]
MPKRPEESDVLEDLLAEALAKYDEGGEPAMAAFVAAQTQHATALERGIRRCREMGLLGTQPGGNAASHPERLGDYKLVRRIGGGGMGVVYEAVQEPFGRRVALKIIKPELLYFEGARERFRREVDAIAKLEHPAIVSVFDAGEHEGVPYFTMEMLDGVTLDQACARLHDRDPAELTGNDLRTLVAPADATGELFTGSWWEAAVRIGTQVALGLRHAHLRGIVHRDVKPSNIVVTPHGQAIVLDFGVAQVRAAADLTRSGATPGSPAFMSPEQRRGQATDERTDVFSLAASLWQLLTLQRPFRDADLQKGTPELRNLRARNRAVPPELDLVLRTAMDPDRDQRYGDMGQFAADLQSVLERRPIQARRLGLRLRLLRWCQRHRTTATVGVALAGAAAVMLVVLLLVQDASRRELQRTNGELASAKTQLESAQERMQQSLDTTLEALHSVQVRLGNDRLLAVPQAQKVAHTVLQEAADLFRGLLQRHADDDNVRWRAARAVQALALSHDRRGDEAGAIALMHEALAILGTDTACTAQTRNIRGHAWKTLGSFLAERRDPAEAENALVRAEADFSPASPDRAQQADNLRALAAIATTRTHMVDERTQPERVEHLYREALRLQRECMALQTTSDRDPILLVHYLGNVGKFLQRTNRAEEALPVLDEALQAVAKVPTEGVWPPAFVLLAEVQEA